MTIHITTNQNIRESIQRRLRLPVRFMSDNLLEGPCASYPELHCEQRLDYWELQGQERIPERSRFYDIISALKSRQRIVAWTSGLWRDKLMLWAFCAWRLRYRPEPPDLDVVILGDAPEDGFSGFVRVEPAEARRGLDDVRALSVAEAVDMARSWRKVCGRYPVLFAENRRPGHAREDLATLGAHQATFFPRMKGKALTLSRFDELLFSCLDKGWSTPADVFMHPSSAGEELRDGWGSRIGDISLAMRLRQWAKYGGDEAALEAVPYREQRTMLEARYRLTSVGHEIKRNGLSSLGQGPPQPIWGVTAYDPKDPWVVVNEDGERPHFERPGKRGGGS